MFAALGGICGEYAVIRFKSNYRVQSLPATKNAVAMRSHSADQMACKKPYTTPCILSFKYGVEQTTRKSRSVLQPRRCPQRITSTTSQNSAVRIVTGLRLLLRPQGTAW